MPLHARARTQVCIKVIKAFIFIFILALVFSPKYLFLLGMMENLACKLDVCEWDDRTSVEVLPPPSEWHMGKSVEHFLDF